jgi:hypothetical protein
VSPAGWFGKCYLLELLCIIADAFMDVVKPHALPPLENPSHRVLCKALSPAHVAGYWKQQHHAKKCKKSCVLLVLPAAVVKFL